MPCDLSKMITTNGGVLSNMEMDKSSLVLFLMPPRGQNDIKKLRRENEQLRREIWSLRDEYDKLEEILKKQKGSREESGEPEDRSGDEAAGSGYSDDDDDQDDDDDEEEDDEEDDDSESADEEKNSESNQVTTTKKSSTDDKVTSSPATTTTPTTTTTATAHRTRVNFDNLPVVAEEEELKKDNNNKDNKENRPENNQHHQAALNFVSHHGSYPFRTTSFDQPEPLTTTITSTAPACFGYQSDCPFVFPNPLGEPHPHLQNSYPNIMPMDGGNYLLMTPGQKSPGEVSSMRLGFDIGTHRYPPGATSNPPASSSSPTPPPPPGWQSSLPRATNFQLGTGPQSPSSPRASHSDMTTQAVVENCKLQPAATTLADKRRAFFVQGSSRSYSLCNSGGQDKASSFAPGRSIDDSRSTVTLDLPISNASPAVQSTDGSSRTKHFFAPLTSRSRFTFSEEQQISPVSKAPTTDDSGTSSDATGTTVVSRYRWSEKGSADVCINGGVPLTNGLDSIEQGDAKAFFSAENLPITLQDPAKKSGSDSSSNPLTKSVSCQDLSCSRLSFTENIKTAKSDTTLDNVSLSAKPFKTQLNVVLKQPGSRKSLSPDVPEIPELPSIDYKLFSNPFLQNFEQAYQNFPVRTQDGHQSPLTHPLSIQVCESPVSATSYSSPVRMQPSFGGSCPPDADCVSCKRRDTLTNTDRLRLTIPNGSKLLDETGTSRPEQQYHVTSFETPSPHTLQIPPMTPYELEALRRMPTGTSPLPQTPRLYQNVPFVPRGAAVYCPGQGVRMYYDTAAMKVPAQTQTSPEDEAAVTPSTQTTTETEPKNTSTETTSNQPSPDPPKKRRSRKEKPGSVKEKRASQRRSSKSGAALKKQGSVASNKDIVGDSKVPRSRGTSEVLDESRSSSTGRESPRKDQQQTKRVSLYFNAKKRPSLSSSRSRSADRDRDGTNSISSREQQQQPAVQLNGKKDKTRRNSTSSGSVPWCACWGNGCV